MGTHDTTLSPVPNPFVCSINVHSLKRRQKKLSYSSRASRFIITPAGSGAMEEVSFYALEQRYLNGDASYIIYVGDAKLSTTSAVLFV